MNTAMKYQWMMMIRSKWLMSFAILFAILSSTVIASSGHEIAGVFTRSTAALLNLSLLLVPLVALLAGSLFIAGEKEDGRLSLILTYPISPRSLTFGLYAGSCISLWTVIAFGYGSASVVLFTTGGTWSTFFFLSFALTIVLTSIFLAIALFIGLVASNRLQALGVSLFIWAFFVLFYEFLTLALLSLVPKQFTILLFGLSVICNPVELMRVWTITAMKSSALFGPQLYEWSKWAESTSGQLSFVAIACVWIIVPLFLANVWMKRGKRHA
ncbi:ABC transporter permease [Anoxybacillus sp. EFIL]|uniref:ABC transporter permease n=1 Tax=Anoxybacillus sp. EFIL TaxID=2508869 RepID=UPI00148BA9DC|nr:ABC transporter permease subunit [Anoxybacillus sp. EFIL]NNU97279.1 copper ABC transporter permease [Anoxybacillus sp. EFIL]